MRKWRTPNRTATRKPDTTVRVPGPACPRCTRTLRSWAPPHPDEERSWGCRRCYWTGPDDYPFPDAMLAEQGRRVALVAEITGRTREQVMETFRQPAGSTWPGLCVEVGRPPMGDVLTELHCPACSERLVFMTLPDKVRPACLACSRCRWWVGFAYEWLTPPDAEIVEP